MYLLVFGHVAPVLVFPTSKGKFYEYLNHGMVGALSEHLEQGWIQLYYCG
jgi:esterase/lipase superfamily enzyme